MGGNLHGAGEGGLLLPKLQLDNLHNDGVRGPDRKTQPGLHHNLVHGAHTLPPLRPLVRREGRVGDPDRHGRRGHGGQPAVRDQPTADLLPPLLVLPAHLRGRVQRRQHQPRPAQLVRRWQVDGGGGFVRRLRLLRRRLPDDEEDLRQRRRLLRLFVHIQHLLRGRFSPQHVRSDPSLRHTRKPPEGFSVRVQRPVVLQKQTASEREKQQCCCRRKSKQTGETKLGSRAFEILPDENLHLDSQLALLRLPLQPDVFHRQLQQLDRAQDRVEPNGEDKSLCDGLRNDAVLHHPLLARKRLRQRLLPPKVNRAGPGEQGSQHEGVGDNSHDRGFSHHRHVLHRAVEKPGSAVRLDAAASGRQVVPLLHLRLLHLGRLPLRPPRHPVLADGVLRRVRPPPPVSRHSARRAHLPKRLRSRLRLAAVLVRPRPRPPPVPAAVLREGRRRAESGKSEGVVRQSGV